MGKRILIVDDEPALLGLLKTFVSRSGHSVEAYTSSTDAWAHFQTNHASYDMAVVDLTMPGLGGEELARQMVELDPNIRILLASGYPFAVDSLPAGIRDRFATLQKPFVPKMLNESIDELLKRKLP